MRMKKVGSGIAIFIIAALLFLYPLDSYISQPGGAYDLAPLVEIDDGDEDDVGTFSLMTISLSKATAATYAFAQISSKRKILPVENVRKAGESETEYDLRQKKMMSDSQFNAITVAFNQAGIPIEVDYNGVYIMNVLEKGASDKILKAGDLIKSIDGVALEESGEFVTLIAEKKLGEKVALTVEREDEVLDVTVVLKEIPDAEGRIGLGVGFQEDRNLTTVPEVTMHTSNIGGPSAGLMFTLEIMNRLLDEDLTKGYNIAGTGEMFVDGTVGRIGGADFKVMAADREGVEIFFAPDDELPEEVKAMNPGIMTNYEEAVQTAKKINSKMKIVPVKSIDDALAYLKKLEANS